MSDSSPHDSGASSFTDLMASLMVIFVLLFVVQLNNASVKKREARDDVLKNLKERLVAIGLGQAVRPDERDRNAIVIVVSDSLLFARGAKEIRSPGRKALDELVPLIAAVVCGDSTQGRIESIVIEGHTDTTWALGSGASVPIEVARDYNMELSQGRSMEVVRHSLRTLSAADTRECLRGLMSASGRGQEEPIKGVPGDDARQRRVVFKIRVGTNLASALNTTLAPVSTAGHKSND